MIILITAFGHPAEPKPGALIIEGKTKAVHEVEGDPGHCLVMNKDRITAGDGAKAHDLQGKAEISNATNAKVFTFLNEAGERPGVTERWEGVVKNYITTSYRYMAG